LKALHIIVHGVVQGVGFRYFTLDVARELGLEGYVKNKPDGSVEIEAQGEDWALNELLSTVRVGPRSAHVSGVEVREIEPREDFEGFSIRF